MECPAALAATVEAFQACQTDEELFFTELSMICNAAEFHLDALDRGKDEAWFSVAQTTLLSSDSLQQYAMNTLAAAAAAMGSEQFSPDRADPSLRRAMRTFTNFIADAVDAGEVNETRRSALLTHDGILAPLRAVAEGKNAYRYARASTMILNMAWRSFLKPIRSPAGSPEAYGTAQSTMLAALRQSAAMLQLKELATAQRQRAVRRARAKGFLRVRPSSAYVHVPAICVLVQIYM